ncbi:MAG: NUDIX hydrolase [Hyphomicrobiales bacterium]
MEPSWTRRAVAVGRRIPVLPGLAWRFARRRAGRHVVAAVAIIFDAEGRVLLAEHEFRHVRWGFPGGWVRPGEHPQAAVRREVAEELGLQVELVAIVDCEAHTSQPVEHGDGGLTLTFFCRLAPGSPRDLARLSPELASALWVLPAEARAKLTAYDARSLALAEAAFERDRAAARPAPAPRTPA